MITTIRGNLSHVETGSLVIEVSGIGLLVHVPDPLSDQARTGQAIFLHTYLVVREDALALYGFDTQDQREYFKLLLAVSGIGPKLALTILSTLTPEAIRRAVFSEQAEIFSQVPGVGLKTAQKIAFSLEDKISREEGYEPLAAMSDADSEVLSALVTLGYSVVEAQAALQSIPKDTPQDVETRLRLALVYFS